MCQYVESNDQVGVLLFFYFKPSYAVSLVRLIEAALGNKQLDGDYKVVAKRAFIFDTINDRSV